MRKNYPRVALCSLFLFSLAGCQPHFVHMAKVGDDLNRLVHMDKSCPLLDGLFIRTPAIEGLTVGHPPRYSDTDHEYIELLLGQSAGRQNQIAIDGEWNFLLREDAFAISQTGGAVYVIRWIGSRESVVKTAISNDISESCDPEGFRQLPPWEVVGWGDGAGTSERYLTKIGRADNGDLIVFRVVAPVGRLADSGIGQAYLARFKKVGAY